MLAIVAGFIVALFLLWVALGVIDLYAKVALAAWRSLRRMFA